MNDTNLVSFIDRVEPKFEFAPPGMVFEQEKSFAIQLLNNNSYLEKTARQSPASLLAAMTNIASIGLSLNPAKKQAYLVPRKGMICLDPSYIGMCDLATQSGSIEFIQAKIVRSEDQYANKGVDVPPEHSYSPFGERGDIVGAYCVAKTSKGAYLTTEMTRAEIDGIKDRSEAGKKGSGPWMTDYSQMALKSVVRQAFKMWPKTQTMERLAQAVELSNQNEFFEPIANNPEIMDCTEDQKKFFDGLITAADDIGMFVFMTSLDHGVQTSLYNSFEKGSITKYKGIVSGMITSGSAQIRDCIQQIEESSASEDDLGVKEIVEDLSQEAIDYIREHASSEAVSFIDGLD